MNIEEIELPKWPAMFVVGDPVTEEQAYEILIRTNNFWFSSNDRSFVSCLNDICGISYDKNGFQNVDSLNKARDRFRVLELSYLINSQIVSSYIGGPHGWCDWNGRIFSNNYNIGKWPTVKEVMKEWELIAKAFPFLKLRCQLFSGEHIDDSKKIMPLIEYNVEGGNVVMKEPKESLGELGPLTFAPLGERGCSIDIFKRAVTIAEKSSYNTKKGD